MMRVRAALLVVVLFATACGGPAMGSAERAANADDEVLAEQAEADGQQITEATIEAVAELASTLDNARYEYFQFAQWPDGATSGSEDVPLARGERSPTGERLTAELGVNSAFAAEHGTDTRMNVLDADGLVCMNVPFYKRLVDEAGADADVAWMVPLIDGWGCLNEDDVANAAGVPSAALDLGDQNLYLRMAEVLRSARIESTQPASFRGAPVTEVTVTLDPLSVARRFERPLDEVASGTATLLFADSDDRLVQVTATIELNPGPTVTERLEIYGRGTVEPVELPEGATDITEPISRVLAD